MAPTRPVASFCAQQRSSTSAAVAPAFCAGAALASWFAFEKATGTEPLTWAIAPSAVVGPARASRTGSSPAPPPSTPQSWLCSAPLALLVPVWAAASRSKTKRRSPQARGSRTKCFFFGGNKDKESKEDKFAQDGEMSDRAQEACAKLQTEIVELKEHAEEKKAAHERLKVEVQNYRTRTRQELAAARGKAAIPLVKELLPIADEFYLVQNNVKTENDKEQAIADRFIGLFDEMLKAWKVLGVEKMEAVGQEFDPELHEAVSMIPSEEYKSDLVCNELRGGWVLSTPGADQKQCLRPALVCVSAGPGPS